MKLLIHRGVSKIVEQSNTIELDDQQVREIVTDVFQQRGLVLPYSIEFEPKPSMDSKPQVYFVGETLRIIASTEPELKRLTGRFVIERSWPSHDWLLANHLGRYILVCLVLLTTLPELGFMLSWLIQELQLVLVTSTVIGVVIFSFWTSHQISFRTGKLVKKLTLEMVDLGCMTEYDGSDYEIDYHLATIGGTIICLWAGLVISILGLMFYEDASIVFMFVLVLLALPSVYYLLTSITRLWGYDLCIEQHDTSNEEESEEVDEFVDNEYLQVEFSDLIERMNIRKLLTKTHESEFDEVRGKFSKTEFAQCRWTNNFVEDNTLNIVCRDVSEAAARRYGIAMLIKSTIPFFAELSFTRKTIQLVAFFFGLFMIVPILLSPYVISKEFGIGTLIFTAVVVSVLGNMGRKQNAEVRRDLPILLRRTGVYNDYELKYYSNKMFSISSRFDWSLMIGFLLIFFVIGYWLFVLV